MTNEGRSIGRVLAVGFAIVVFTGAGALYFYESAPGQSVPSSSSHPELGPSSTTFQLDRIPSNFTVGSFQIQTLCSAPCAYGTANGTVTNSGYTVLLNVSLGTSHQTMEFGWPPVPPPTTVPSPPEATAFAGELRAAWSANTTGVYLKLTASS